MAIQGNKEILEKLSILKKVSGDTLYMVAEGKVRVLDDGFGHLLTVFDQDGHHTKIIIGDDANQEKETHYRKLFGFCQKPAPGQAGKFPITEDSALIKYVEAIGWENQIPKAPGLS